MSCMCEVQKNPTCVTVREWGRYSPACGTVVQATLGSGREVSVYSCSTIVLSACLVYHSRAVGVCKFEKGTSNARACCALVCERLKCKECWCVHARMYVARKLDGDAEMSKTTNQVISLLQDAATYLSLIHI